MHFLKKFNLIFLFGAFIILYNPPLLPFNSMHLVGLFSILYLLISGGFSRSLFGKNSIAKKLLVSCLAIFIYLLVFSFGINGGKLDVILFPLYFVIDVIPFGCALLTYWQRNSLSTNDFLDFVIAAGLFQATLSLISFVVPSIHDLFVRRIVDYGYGDNLFELADYRLYGFASGLTFSMPVLNAFLAILCLIKDRKITIFGIIKSLFLVFSAIINARISLFIFLFGLLIFILFSKYSIKKRIGIIALMAALIYGFVSFGLPFIKQMSLSTYEWLFKGIDETIFFFQNKTASTSVYAYMTDAEKYRLPLSLFGMLFGEGERVMGGSSFGFMSDVGYINDLWLGGVVLCVALYLMYLFPIISMFKTKNSLFRFLSVYCFITFVFCNIKGYVFSMNSFSAFFFILSIIALQNRKNIECTKTLLKPQHA